MDQHLQGLPSELQQLLGMVSKTIKIAEVQAAWALTVRVPFVDYAEIRTLSEYSGRSINQVLVHVVRVGLQALKDALPQEDVEQIDLLRPGVLCDLYAKGDVEQYREGELPC